MKKSESHEPAQDSNTIADRHARTTSKTASQSDPQAGDWVKALIPGTSPGNLFRKAGDKFQLQDGESFSDRWMERTDAPATVEPPDPKTVQAEQEKSVREHEKADQERRGKFSIPSVPRSEEGEREHQERLKREAAAPPIDRGSRDPRAPGGIHETSANPSRLDENARRHDK